MEKSEIVKGLLVVATPLVSSVTEVFIKPKLQELCKKLEIKKNAETVLIKKFEDYLLRSYENTQ